MRAGGPVVDCAFSPDTTRLTATVSRSLGVREHKVWDIASGEEVADTLERPAYSATESERRRVGLGWPESPSPDGRLSAALDEDGLLRILNLATGSPIAQWWVGSLHAPLAWHPRGARIAVGSESGDVFLLRLENHPEAHA